MVTMSAFKAYEYRALPTEIAIRILVLHPARDFISPLEVSLIHHTCGTGYCSRDTEHYEAVFYCWGEPDFSQSVQVRGTGTSLAITPNVDSMLRHLRLPVKRKSLWIDALCINQANPLEKARQVRKMDDIYRLATKVHIWLGADTSLDSEAVFAHVTNLAQQSDSSKRSSDEPRGLDQTGEHVDANLHRLLSNPWFTRRWVLQEIALGHNIIIHCGSDQIARERFVKGLLAQKESIEASAYPTSVDTYTALTKALTIMTLPDREPSDLYDMLVTHVAAKCFDHRDRFFALYGITRRAHSSSLLQPPIDYVNDWCRTYTKAAQALIKFRPGAYWRHLQLFRPLFLSCADGPSWIRDWRNTPRISTSRGDTLPLHGDEKTVTLDNKPGLQLKGWLYGDVSDVWNVPQSGHPTLHSVIEAAASRCSALPEPPPSAQSRLNLVKHQIQALVTVAARFFKPFPGFRHRSWDLIARDRQLLRVWSLMWERYDKSQPLFGKAKSDDIAAVVNEVLQHHKLFRATRSANDSRKRPRELFGISDGDVQLGDSIFRCSGKFGSEHDDQPFLLVRPFPTDSKGHKRSYKLIGFCFISGARHERMFADRFVQDASVIPGQDPEDITLV